MEKFAAAIGRRWTFMEHMELPAYRDGLLVAELRQSDPAQYGLSPFSITKPDGGAWIPFTVVPPL